MNRSVKKMRLLVEIQMMTQTLSLMLLAFKCFSNI